MANWIELKIEARNVFDKFMPAKEKIVSVFGYRPNNGLPEKYGTDITNAEFSKMKDVVKYFLVDNDVTKVISGLSNGTELALSYAVYELKEKGYPIELEICQVFKGYNEVGKNKELVINIKNKADKYTLISNGDYSNKAFGDFNKYLITSSDICLFIASSNIEKNIKSIQYSIESAKRQKKEIVLLDYETLKRA
jgi:uncharacterized phage-like protein YoqJ